MKEKPLHVYKSKGNGASKINSCCDVSDAAQVKAILVGTVVCISGNGWVNQKML